MITPYSNTISVTTEKFPFEFSVKTDNGGVSSSTQFKMPLTTSVGLNFDVDWGDGSPIENITDPTLAIHTYASAGTYTIKITGSLSGWQFNDLGDKLKMLNVVTWGALNISVNSGFRGCTNLTCSATDAPVITTTSLESYFQSCTNFNGAIGNWNVSNVTNMQQMFNGATAFNQPIGSWNVSNVTTMDRMLQGATAFNQDIGSWNVSNVNNMRIMFENATAFNQDIGSWNVSNVTNFTNFMAGKIPNNYSVANLNSIYNGWSSLPSVKPNISINFGSIVYLSASQSGKDILTSAPNNWIISDGGVVRNQTFEFSVKTDNVGVSTSTQFRMPLASSNGLFFNVDWGDGSPIETITDHTLAIHTYAVAGTYTISTVGNIQSWSFGNSGDRLKMLDVLQWAGLHISLGNGFFGCTNLTCTATDAPLITSTSLVSYFQSCTNFNGAIGNWNVSNVTNMSAMFFGATNFNANISTKTINVGQPNEYIAWNVSNVTNMGQMFIGATAFNQPIGSWNVSKVTTMDRMLQGATNFNQDIGAWNVANVTTMRLMFDSATNFNQDIGAWNVSNVTTFENFMVGKSNLNYSAANLASIYNGWSQLTLKPNINITFNTIDYCDTAEANKQSIVTNFGWNIIDGNAVPC